MFSKHEVLKITLLSSLFKYFSIQKRVINKNTLQLYAAFLHLYTQRSNQFLKAIIKANNTSIIKNKLTFINVGDFAPFF